MNIGISDEAVQKAIAGIKAGRTCLSMAAEIGVGSSALSIRLRKLGYRINNRRVPCDPEQARWAMDLYMQGAPIAEIAEKLNLVNQGRATTLIMFAARKLGYGHYPMRIVNANHPPTKKVRGKGFKQEGEPPVTNGKETAMKLRNGVEYRAGFGKAAFKPTVVPKAQEASKDTTKAQKPPRTAENATEGDVLDELKNAVRVANAICDAHSNGDFKRVISLWRDRA